MKERPILFSGEMVRAILKGRKTQTRRIIKPQPFRRTRSNGAFVWFWQRSKSDLREFLNWDGSTCGGLMRRGMPELCRYGLPGDRLWVKETCWRGFGNDKRVAYVADSHQPPEWAFKKAPSIHMPRWASRITLEVVSVRVERLQEISEADAIAEGVQSVRDHYGDPSIPLMHCGTVAWQRYDGAACAAPSAKLSYQSLWESINGPGSWADNPWVWAVEFKRLEAQ